MFQKIDTTSLLSRKYEEQVNKDTIEKLISYMNNPSFKLPRLSEKDKYKDKSDREIVNDITKQLKNYLKNYSSGKVRVQYKYAGIHEKSHYGRVYPKNSLSLSAMPREIRGTLAQEYYKDIDIVNAHPVILEQILDTLEIPHKYLSQYINDRETILADIMNQYKVNRDAAKNLFIRIMYNGTFKTWAKEYNVEDTQASPFITNFKNELFDNYSKIIKHPEFENDIRILKEDDAIRKDNPLGSTMSNILQNIECQILTVMIEYLKSNKKRVGNVVLCFDGFCILKESVTCDLLEQLESVVHSRTGFKIKLAIKNFTVINIDEPLTNYIAPHTESFDQEVMKEASNYGYDAMKEYFERFHVYCTRMKSFVLIDTTIDDMKEERNMIQQHTRKELIDAYNFYDKTVDIKHSNFIKRWLVDPDRKYIFDVVFKPFNGAFSDRDCFITEENNGTKTSYINTFLGYSPKINNQATEKDITEFNDFIENYFKPVVKNLCEDNERYMDHVIKYFAQLIQRPDDRPYRALVFVSDQGEGKGRLLDTITRVIGEHNFSQEPDYKEAYFSTHSIAHANKLLVNADESSAAGNFDLEGLIKSFITKPTITINEKYQKQYQLENYARMIFTSNKLMALPIDFKSGDRRFDLFESARKFSELRKRNPTEDTRFWRHYSKVIDSDYFPSLMYNYLNSIDISEWDSKALQNEVTKLREEMEEIAREPHEEFFEDYFETLKKNYYDVDSSNHDKITVPVATIYEAYKKYCELNLRKPANNVHFSRNMRSSFSDIIELYSSNSKRHYIIDVQNYCERFDVDFELPVSLF